MLKFSVLFLTSRKAMIEVEDFGIWNTNEPYEIWLNGEKYMESDRETLHESLPSAWNSQQSRMRGRRRCGNSSLLEAKYTRPSTSSLPATLLV